MGKISNQLLCSLHKSHSTQHEILRLIQLWQKKLDESGLVESILMDLSKAYDYLPYGGIIAKLEAYGLAK